MRISINKTILLISLVLLSISLALCNTVYINYTLKRKIEVLAIIMSAIYLVKCAKFKSTKIKKITLLFVIVLLFFAWGMVYFTHINVGLIIKDDSTVTALLDAGVICSYFLLITRSVSMNHFLFAKKYIVFILGSFVVINDIMLYMIPEMAKLFGGIWWTSYFVGTKFDVGYLHLFFIATLFSTFFQGKKHNICKNTLLIVLLILSIYSSFFVDCNTGMISAVLFFILVLSIKKKYTVFIKPQVFCSILIASLLFVIGYSVILNSSIVKFLVQDIFNRDLSLTGRTAIYKLLRSAMAGNIWTGYGYGINYTISQTIFNYDNTQNGLMEWILQIGIIGTVLLIIFLYVIFYIVKKSKPSNSIVPILSFIYVLTIIAMIEISLDLFYFMAIGFLYGIALDEEKIRNTGLLEN